MFGFISGLTVLLAYVLFIITLYCVLLCRNVSPPTFFFFRSDLDVLGPYNFHINFKFAYKVKLHKKSLDAYLDCSDVSVVTTGMFIMLNLLSHECGISLIL